MFPIFLPALLLLCSPVLSSTQEVFAYYKLALQWPISFCNVRPSCSKTISSSQQFTVHGLWPFWANHTILEPCPKSGLGLTMSQVKDILDDLRVYWPNFEGDDFIFWSAQWEKHGRCLHRTSFSYFKDTVLRAKQYRNCLRTLNRPAQTFSSSCLNPNPSPPLGGGIYMPGHTARTEHYKMKELYAYFQQAVKPKSSLEAPQIQFKCNRRNGRFQLLEFYICISRRGEVLDCPSPAFINCGRNEMAMIWYPNETTLPPGVYQDRNEEL
nr:intracellular ribonuclease lx [Quercus suber]